MKTFKFNISVFSILFLLSSYLSAQPSIYESYVIIDNGSGNYYYNMAGSSSNTDIDNHNFGEFNSTNSLVLNGHQHKIYESCGITYSKLFYKIEAVGADDGSFSSINASWQYNSGNDEIWETTSESINILNGLNLGNYKITFKGEAKHNSGNCTNPDEVVYDNNGGSNYVAYFTISESNANSSISGDLSFTNFTVDNGVTLTIEKSGSLNVSGTLTNNGAIVMNSASNEIFINCWC